MVSPQPEPGRELATDGALEAALRAGLQRVESEQSESAEDIAFTATLERDQALLDLDRARLTNDNERGLIDLRKTYGRNMIRFLWAYFVIAIAIVVADGCRWLSLPDTVLVSLIGGTAVSVLGVVGTIVAGLFKVNTLGEGSRQKAR